jgi:hypothetical protein
MCGAGFLIMSKKISLNLMDDDAIENAVCGAGISPVSDVFGQCCVGHRHADDHSIAPHEQAITWRAAV